jgi:ABC-type amino acid transport substrate-binding protein
MFVLGYRHISINYNLKRLLGLLLAGALLIQMGGVAAQQTVYYETAWDPATDWVEQNVEHDEVIYYHRTPRNFAIRVDSAYKFITTTEKEGYVHPSENFSEVISDRADYVIINDAALAGEKAKVKIANKSGVINKIKTIDIKQPIKIKDTTIYQVDRKWSIYKTKGTSN